MIFPNFFKNTHCRKAVDDSFRRYQQYDSQNRVLFVNLRIVGDAANDSMFDCLLTLTLLNFNVALKRPV